MLGINNNYFTKIISKLRELLTMKISISEKFLNEIILIELFTVAQGFWAFTETKNLTVDENCLYLVCKFSYEFPANEKSNWREKINYVV